MPRRYFSLTIRGLIWLSLLINAGCDQPTRESEDTNTLLLNWIPDAQHGGFFAARQRLKEAIPPLDLEIRAGRPGTPVLQQLEMGKVDFAIANADQVLLARAQGADLVAVFAPMQNNPRCIMVHDDSPARTIAELSDITLAMGEGNPFAEFLKAGAGWRNVRIVAYSGSVAAFMENRQYAQQAYVFSEPIVVRQRGGACRCLMVSDLGFNPYAGLLITRRDFITTSAPVVQRVVQAARQGWIEYLESPASVNATLRQLNEEMTGPILDQSVTEIRALCLPTDMPMDQIGTMDKARWSELAEQLVKLKLLEQMPDVTQAFTTQFLVESPDTAKYEPANVQ